MLFENGATFASSLLELGCVVEPGATGCTLEDKLPNAEDDKGPNGSVPELETGEPDADADADNNDIGSVGELSADELFWPVDCVARSEPVEDGKEPQSLPDTESMTVILELVI